MMQPAVATVHVPDFDELRGYVREVLCRQADLDLQTPLIESTLRRRGEPVGIEYLLLAPRSIRLSAVWESQRDRVLFYDQKMTRFQTTPVRGPDPRRIAQRPRPDVQVESMWNGK